MCEIMRILERNMYCVTRRTTDFQNGFPTFNDKKPRSFAPDQSDEFLLCCYFFCDLFGYLFSCLVTSRLNPYHWHPKPITLGHPLPIKFKIRV